jgi:hypothetical protein
VAVWRGFPPIDKGQSAHLSRTKNAKSSVHLHSSQQSVSPDYPPSKTLFIARVLMSVHHFPTFFFWSSSVRW